MTEATSILLPYQVRWSRDSAQVKLWEKSRRIGASYGEAADDVLHAAARDGGSVFYISYNKDMTATFIDDCATWARAFHSAMSAVGESIFKRDDDRDIHVFDLQFDSGNQIQAFSNNPRNLRSKGRPGDRVVIDEAAFVDDLEELLKSAMAVTMWGGEVRIMSTHNGTDNPFNGLIQDCLAGRYDYSVHRTTLDDALADGLYRRICQVTGKGWTQPSQDDWRAALVRRYRPNSDEELFCVPAMGGGAYLPRALIESCLPSEADSGPLIRFDGDARFNALPEAVRAREMADWIREHLDPALERLDQDRRHVIGEDFARSGDMTDIVIVEIGASRRRTWKVLIEMRNVPFSQQKQVLHHAIRRAPRLSCAALDARGNGQQIAEEARDAFGSVIAPIMPTEAFYRENFPRYKASLEDRETTLIRHDDVVEDHRAVRLVRGVPRIPDQKTDKKGERHGDSVMAGLLAEFAAHEAPAVYAYHPARPAGAATPGDHRRSRREIETRERTVRTGKVGWRGREGVL